MRLRAITGMTAAAVALAPTGASAQSSGQEMELGSRIARPKPADIPDTRLTNAERGRATLFQFAECAERSQARKVQAYLTMKRDDPQSDATLDKLATDQCLRSGELSMPSSLLRGAMFRTVYLRQFERVPAKLADTEVDFDTFLIDPKAPQAQQYRILMDFADCVVRKDVANADKLVRARVGTPEENNAVAALMPSFGPCMVAGAQVTLNRSVINAALSEALYREASAVPADGTAGKH